MNLEHKRILLTGGSLGIGKETAKLLVDAGAFVAITGRDQMRLEKAAAYTGAFPICGDISNEEQLNQSFETFIDKWKGIDVLINNAGIGSFPSMLDITMEKYEEIFRTNVFAPALLAKKAAHFMIPQKSGTIINIGSTAALKSFEKGGIYAASKFALRAMTEAWQAELRKHSIRVMQINPSEVATAFNNQERIEREAATHKLRSLDIAYAIKSVLELDDRAFIPELSVWATNPWNL